MEWIPVLLISGLCTSSSFCANDRQHCLVETPKSWKDAQSFCRERGSDLATIDDIRAMESLLPLIDNKPDNVWIGLYPGGSDSWYWSLADDDFYKEGARDYRNFLYEGPESAAYLDHGWWNTSRVSYQIFAMCYDANKQGRDRYVLVPQRMTATAAQEYCREHHTDMVAIRNHTENQIINEVSAGNRVWIGIFKDPWTWSDERYSSLRFWIGEKYYSRPLKSFCASLVGSQGGRWLGERCVNKHPFLCACNRARVLKVKVHSEDLQDLNDDATKAAILKQLVEDLTLPDGHKVMWRTRPDGQVFTQEQRQEEDEDMGDAQECMNELVH